MLAPVLSLHDLLSMVGQNQPGAPGQMRARISLKQRAERDISTAEERKPLEMHKYIYMYTRGCVNTRKFFHPELSSSFRVHSIYLFAGNFPTRSASPNSPHAPAVPSSPGHRRLLFPSLPFPSHPPRCRTAPGDAPAAFVRDALRGPASTSARGPGRRRPGGAEPSAPLRNSDAPSTYLGPRPERCREPRCREPRRRTKATPSGAPRAGLLFTVPRLPAFPFLPRRPVTKESAPGRRFLRPASAAAGRPLLLPRRPGRAPSMQARRPAGREGRTGAPAATALCPLRCCQRDQLIAGILGLVAHCGDGKQRRERREL